MGRLGQSQLQNRVNELVTSRDLLQQELARRERVYKQYQTEVQNQMKVAVLDIQRRQREVLRKLPKVREELDQLRSLLDGDLAITDQMYQELKTIVPQALTPKQLILVRMHEEKVPLRSQRDRALKELADVRMLKMTLLHGVEVTTTAHRRPQDDRVVSVVAVGEGNSVSKGQYS